MMLGILFVLSYKEEKNLNSTDEQNLDMALHGNGLVVQEKNHYGNRKQSNHTALKRTTNYKR